MTTALLVIDMQQYFSGMAKKATPNIKALQKYFQENSQPIIYTQHGHPEEDFRPPYKNQLVRRWGPSRSIHRGSPEWELIPWVKKSVGESPIVAKNTYDAFVNTNLPELLEKDGVERLVICGVMTDCCCETTARSAFNRGWETWLVSDACYSVDDEQHQRSLDAFVFGYGPLWTTEEALDALKKENCM
ncbi:putative Isochorismatase-like domain-containing protein [Seiridium cardinale]|uniref:Isochorismatase-like domain-containing protein n=1 Tax=Seiridium cardinale TaxID=138064 RepID=A0ABR2Y238_9PEZI